METVRPLSFSIALCVVLAGAPLVHAAPGAPEVEAEAEMQKAKQAMERAQYDVAVGHLLVARSLVPDASGPYLNLGVAYERLGRCGEAVPMLEEYLRRKPKSPSPIAARSLEICRAKETAAAPTPPVTTTPPPPATATTPPGPLTPDGWKSIDDDGPDAPRLAEPAEADHRAVVGGFRARRTTPTPLPAPVIATPPPAHLTVRVGPVGANLRLNGQPAGVDVLNMDRAIRPGTYELYADRPGYQPISRTGWLVPGEVHVDVLTMKKKRVWPIVVGVLTAAAVAGGVVAIVVTQVHSGKKSDTSTGNNQGTGSGETVFPPVYTP
jgi:hypothetical protein